MAAIGRVLVWISWMAGVVILDRALNVQLLCSGCDVIMYIWPCKQVFSFRKNLGAGGRIERNFTLQLCSHPCGGCGNVMSQHVLLTSNVAFKNTGCLMFLAQLCPLNKISCNNSSMENIINPSSITASSQCQRKDEVRGRGHPGRCQ